MVYWVLQFVSGPASPLSAAVAAPAQGVGTVDAQALAKGLGGGAVRDRSPEAAPAAPSIFQAARFVLTGVVVNRGASSQASPSVALIGVDGKPPRPYRVGASLADGIVLHSVSAGKAMLASSTDAPVGLTLELPQLISAVAGTAIAPRPAMPAVAPPSMAAPNDAASPMSALGQRQERLGANRERGDDRAKDRVLRRQESASRKSPQEAASAP